MIKFAFFVGLTIFAAGCVAPNKQGAKLPSAEAVQKLSAAAQVAGGQLELTAGAPVSLNLYDGNNPLKGKGGLNVRVTDAWLAHVVGFATLTNLDLANCDIRGPGLAHVSQLGDLRRLNLTLTPVTDDSLAALAGLTRLQVFSLASTHCTGRGFRALGALQDLRNLNFHYTPVDDDGLREISRLTQLERIEIVHTQFTDAGAVHLAKITGLRRLQLGSRKATGASIAAVAKLPALRELDLHDGQASAEGVRHAAGIASLRVLRVYGAIGDAGVAPLSQLVGLEELVAPSCGLTDASVETLVALKKLLRINLSGNKISEAGMARLRAALPLCEIVVR